MHLRLAVLAAILAAGPLHAQTFGASGMGIHPGNAPRQEAPKGSDSLLAIAPQLPTADAVRIGWALLRIVPTARSGRHTHALNATYFPSMPACEAARGPEDDRSPYTLCLPVALPPY